MNSPYKMTGQQAEERMQLYREIFTVVRLLDAGDLRLSGSNEDKEYQTGKMEHCSCYEYWKKNEPCENCISRKVYQDRKQRTKLEYKGNELFEVTACFVEVDGKPCVMELVRRMDGELLIDAEGREKLLNRLTSYHDELYIDALTGAYNRRYYEDKIKTSVQKGGIAMIDLDDFKLYNDTCGHDAGDAVLKTIVLIIRSCIRDADSLIRYGGDEFLLLMPDISREEFEEFLQRIKQKIHESEVPGYTQLNLSVSTGGVLMDGAETVEDAAIRADKLMYRAKNRKNMVVTAGSREETQQQGQAEEVQNNIKQQILIVDDSALNREILSEMLHSDFRILEAENGEQSISVLEQYGTGIALILLDIVMPGMNGFEVTRKLKNEFTTSHIPIILLTALNIEEKYQEGIESGADAYITKPFNVSLLLARIFKLIELRDKLRQKYSNEPGLAHSIICTNDKDQKFSVKLNEVLNEHMTDTDFSVNDFAGIMGLGRTVFYKKVRGVTGYSPYEYLRVMRMKKAAEMLLTEDLTIAEVAYSVGINDPFYFSKCFKNQFGVSPSAYRKKLSEDENEPINDADV